MISKWPLQIYAVPFLLGGQLHWREILIASTPLWKSSIYKQTWEEFYSNGALHEKINKFIHCSWNLSDNNLALVTFAHFGNWPWIIAELNPPADNWKLLSYNTINCKLSSKCTYCLWIGARKRYFRKDHKAKIKIIDKFGCHNDIQNVKYFA